MKAQSNSFPGTTLIESCIFQKIENSSSFISGVSFDIYNTFFIECNAESKAYSILASKNLFISNTVFESSGGSATPYDPQNPSSTVRFHSVLSNDIRSDCFFTFSQASIDIYQMNLTNSICHNPIDIGNGPHQLLTKFISLISNECRECAKLEADYGHVNRNSHFQFVRNKCSYCLFEVYRADCYCDWFYFINNNLTSCRQIGNNRIIFSNTFSTGNMIVLAGITSGVVNLDNILTEVPFPTVMVRRPMTGNGGRMRIILTIGLNFILFYFLLKNFYFFFKLYS